MNYGRGRARPLLSIVLPVFNEAQALQPLLDLIRPAAENAECDYEIVFVNDGSTDESPRLLDRIALVDPRVRVVHFSRNFGHQSAVQAGIVYALGDAIVVMDSDLQDDPRALSAMVAKWREGYEVVYAVRHSRKEGPLKRLLFHAFYRVLNLVAQMPMPRDAGNFGLIDRRVAQHIINLADSDRFYPGLRSWVGFRQTGVPVERLARYDDHPRVSMWGLVQLAKTAVFSFSRVPLSLFYAVAALSTLVCAACCSFALYHKMVTGLAIPGWTSSVVIGSFFGALNALGIGVLGEYVIRIYDQVRARPPFIVDRVENPADLNAKSPLKRELAEQESRSAQKGREDQETRTFASAPIVAPIDPYVPVAAPVEVR
ncbi:MAG: glycosyltransferase family 2 protein [Planctomycetales bacterium]|nr:glycosyltransferase family 2 protein [Planctomycetales bacterium]